MVWNCLGIKQIEKINIIELLMSNRFNIWKRELYCKATGKLQERSQERTTSVLHGATPFTDGRSLNFRRGALYIQD